MGNTSALYCGFTPETWQKLYELPANDKEGTLTENAEAVLQLSDIVNDVRSDFPIAQHADEAQLKAWQGLLAVLGFDSEAEAEIPPPAKTLPDWLLDMYPPDGHYLALSRPETLIGLSEAILASDLAAALEATAQALSWPGILKHYTLLQFVHACARQGRVLLAIESMG